MRSSRPLLLKASILLAFAAVLPEPSRAEEAPQAASQSPQFDRVAIRDAVGKIAAGFRAAYVYPDKASQAAEALEKALSARAYDGLADPDQFARRMEADLRSLTGDNHIFVVRNLRPPAEAAPPPPSDAGFGRVDRLKGNIGYVRLNRFAPPAMFKDAADNALRLVADTDALIFDMRGNRGGHPQSVAYLSSFLLDPTRPVHLASSVWRNKGTSDFRTEEFWTSPTPIHYLDKPVYILVGPETFSAGEAFAYHLQAFKRATIIGAKTKGGAHGTEPDAVVQVGWNIFLAAPNGRSENPVTKSNWDGVGVQPDIASAPDAALEVAIGLASARRPALAGKGGGAVAPQSTWGENGSGN